MNFQLRFVNCLHCAGAPDLRTKEPTVTIAFAPPQSLPQSRTSEAEQFARIITMSVFEALAGVRRVEQLATWFDRDAYFALARRATMTQRARLAQGVKPKHPIEAISTIRTSSPRSDAVEATIIVACGARTRAVAVRIEHTTEKWRVCSFTIL